MKLKIIFLISCSSLVNFVHAELWTKKADFGGVGRHRAVGVSIGNMGYIGLGHRNGSGVDISYNDWWQFDPASNSWTQKANYPLNNHGACAWATDSRAYVGGGSYLNGEFYQYNPQTNSWSAIATCPISPGDVQVFSVQNKGYIYSGNQFYEYNPSLNFWTIKATPPMSFSTWSSSFATSSSGYVKSGMYLYEYKPSMDQWIQRANFPGLSTQGSSGFCRENKGYIICGFVGSLSVVTDEMWEYNPGNNTWNLICTFPGTSRRFPVAFSIKDKGYFGTGTNGVNFNDFWEFDYDPLGNVELSLTDFEMNVYPNPAEGNVTFQLSGLQSTILDECSLIIYSSTGKLLSETEISSENFSIERKELPKGIYFYSINYMNNVLKQGKLTYY